MGKEGVGMEGMGGERWEVTGLRVIEVLKGISSMHRVVTNLIVAFELC